MPDFEEGFGPSIFDQEALDESVDIGATPHDPMHGALRSGFPWEQQAQEVDQNGQVLPGQPPRPHEGPRTAYAPGLPPNPEYLCCVDGPCKHYAERLAELDAVGAEILTEVHRVCTGFGPPFSLSEGTCFACTKYQPAFWTPATIRRAIIIAHRISVGRRRLGRRTMTLREKAVEVLYSIVKGDAPELPRDEKR
jgi:hypothetical protein